MDIHSLKYVYWHLQMIMLFSDSESNAETKKAKAVSIAAKFYLQTGGATTFNSHGPSGNCSTSQEIACTWGITFNIGISGGPVDCKIKGGLV